MANRLKDMVVSSVHLVDKGDNPPARILLYKRDAEPAEDPEIAALAKATAAEIEGGSGSTAPVILDDLDSLPDTPENRSKVAKWFQRVFFGQEIEKAVPTFDNLQDRDALKGLMGEAYSLTDTYLDALDRAIWDAPYENEDPRALVNKNTDQFKSALDELVGNYAKRAEVLAKKGAQLTDEFFKRKREVRKGDVGGAGAEPGEETEATPPAEEPPAEEGSTGPEDPAPEQNDEGSEEVTVTQQMIDAQLTEVEKTAPEVAKEIRLKMAAGTMAPSPDTEEGRFEKALQELPEGLRGIFKAQHEQLAEMRKAEEARSYVEKARPLTAMPVSHEELGKVLHRVAKSATTAEDEEYLLDIFKSANQMLAHSQMLESASGGQVRKNTPGTVENELYAKAREIAKRDSISEEAALGKVPTEDPTLYAKYEEARRAEARGEVV